MIKITLPADIDKKIRAKFATYFDKIKDALEVEGKKYKNKIRCFYEKVSSDLDTIFYNDIAILEKYSQDILKLFKFTDDELRNLKDSFFEPKYTTFRTAYGKWFGEITNIKVCPYCNINYTYNYDEKSQKTTFELDHFFPKAQYPWLSLSFYNLIPCCGTCNHIKNDAKTDLKKNAYPYPYPQNIDCNIQLKISSQEEIIENSLFELRSKLATNATEIENEAKKLVALKEALNKYEQELLAIKPTQNYEKKIQQEKIKKKKIAIDTKETEQKELLATKNNLETEIQTKLANKEKLISDTFGINFFYGNLDSFSLEFEPSVDKAQALNENITTFHLRERYQEHKDYAYELVKKSWYYSPSYIAALYDTYAGTLFSSEEEIKRLAIGNYYQAEDMGKRPLSKLTRDIAKQFGLY